jgi:hypothetical protein
MNVSQGDLVQWRANGLAILKQDGIRADVVATDASVPNSAPAQ